jgi:cob(I)alamin adenosyltransferase
LLYGQRVPKSHPQIEAVGAFDELNAAIGFAKAVSTIESRRGELELIQRDLVNLMGEIACAQTDAERYAASKFPKLEGADLARIDAAVAELESRNLRFDGWATPGATLPAAALDLARTAARRAERRLVALAEHGRTMRDLTGQYVNRVADLLWLMARDEEGGPGIRET